MTRVLITENELLAELVAANAQSGPADARTVNEMVDETGVSERRVRKALHAMQAAGRLSVHRVRRTALDGRSSLVAAYVIAPATKPARKRGK